MNTLFMLFENSTTGEQKLVKVQPGSTLSEAQALCGPGFRFVGKVEPSLARFRAW